MVPNVDVWFSLHDHQPQREIQTRSKAFPAYGRKIAVEPRYAPDITDQSGNVGGALIVERNTAEGHRSAIGMIHRHRNVIDFIITAARLRVGVAMTLDGNVRCEFPASRRWCFDNFRGHRGQVFKQRAGCCEIFDTARPGGESQLILRVDVLP